MNIIPYRRIKIRSALTSDQVKTALLKVISKPDWNISINKVVNNRILEGRVVDNLFTVVMGKYGLTYGRTSLLPIMKGVIKDDSSGGTILDIVIRPFKAGIIGLGVFYLFGIAALYFSITKHLPQVFIVACIFFCVTYFSVVSKFNKEIKNYDDLIKNIF